MRRFQVEISTVKLVANFGKLVKRPEGWLGPIGLPSGGEPGVRSVGTATTAQRQLNIDN